MVELFSNQIVSFFSSLKLKTIKFFICKQNISFLNTTNK